MSFDVEKMKLKIEFSVDISIVAFITVFDEQGQRRGFFDYDIENEISLLNARIFGYRLGRYKSFEKAERQTMKIIMDNKRGE